MEAWPGKGEKVRTGRVLSVLFPLFLAVFSIPLDSISGEEISY